MTTRRRQKSYCARPPTSQWIQTTILDCASPRSFTLLTRNPSRRGGSASAPPCTCDDHPPSTAAQIAAAVRPVQSDAALTQRAELHASVAQRGTRLLQSFGAKRRLLGRHVVPSGRGCKAPSVRCNPRRRLLGSRSVQSDASLALMTVALPRNTSGNTVRRRPFGHHAVQRDASLAVVRCKATPL